MANLFEINTELQRLWDAAVDQETGEINEDILANFEALEMDRTTKIENIGCWIKNLKSDAEALKAEAKAMADRAKSAERKAESLKSYLEAALQGEKFQTAKVAITWRKVQAVEVDDAEVEQLPEQYVRRKISVEPDKTAIKDALKDGESIEGCRLIERQSMSIK